MAYLVIVPCLAQKKETQSSLTTRKYWNAGTSITPYRLPPPPIGYKPEYIDLNGDEKPDAIRSVTANDTPILWLDDDGSMKMGDLEGNSVNGCLLIDRNKNGKFGFWGDVIIDWVDTDDNGKADMQIILEYPDSIPGQLWPNGHYMIVLDTDHDRIFNYMDWNTFKLRNWEHSGLADFYTDYSGNSAFIKIHAYTNAIDDLRLNWENPFLFYDPDGDGLSEMAIRLVDTPQYYDGMVEEKATQRGKLTGRINWVSAAIDMDNDTGPGNEFDYDMTLSFRGKGFDYMDQTHPIKNLRGLPEADKYFMDPRYRQLTELIYPDHKAAPRLIFERGEWNQIYFVYDEDDDCKRWERVELYDPKDPFIIGTGKGGIDNNSQSDAAGDRGEWDMDASGGGKLYFSKFDGRLHLYGAEWGCWRIDKDAAAYQGFDRQWLKKEPKKFATVKYTDTDNNGFFDKIEYDWEADGVFEETADLKKSGINDQCEIIDISRFEYADYHQLKIRMAENMWANALLAEKVAGKFGLNLTWYAKLHESVSLFQKYSNGYWLQLYLYKDLQDYFLRKNDEENLKKLERSYYTSSWEMMLH
ncbi:MAG: hypothetical protein ABFD09_00905 [Proteiniphilum sp.]